MSQIARTDLPVILVIDDSDDDFDTVVIAAKRAKVGNPLVHVRNVTEARQLFSQLSTATYAFVFLDCNLPGEDGLTLLEELRQHPQHCTLPIIVLTASINPRDRNAFYAAGANAYHVKLVNFAEGLANLENVFHYWLTQVVLPTTDASIIGKTRWQ